MQKDNKPDNIKKTADKIVAQKNARGSKYRGWYFVKTY